MTHLVASKAELLWMQGKKWDQPVLYIQALYLSISSTPHREFVREYERIVT